MRYFSISLLLAFSVILRGQTCASLYSYSANFETVHFFNQSTISNIHYYWNFGDGTSSEFKDPIHEFPENGKYLVTLYVHDTITNCSNYYEQWLNITKFSSDLCSPELNDSIYSPNGGINNYIKFINASSNCNNYTPRISALGDNGYGYFQTYTLPNVAGNWISTLRYHDSQQLKRTSSKTLPWKYDRSKNYQGCSANFEFKVISEDLSGQTFLFTAMNKNAASYQWYFIGFGDPIIRTNDTAIFKVPGDINFQLPNLPYDVFLTTSGQSGCVDSLWQSVVVRKKSVTYVGLEEFDNENIKIELFPNPAPDKIKLEFDPAKVSLNQLNICNTLGQMLLIVKSPQAQQEIDISNFSNGVYFFKVQNSSGQKMFKVLKE